MAVTALDRFILTPATTDPGGVAVIDAATGTGVTRGELADGVLRAAGALAALGIQPEQRVILALADRPAFLHAFFGAMAIGAVPVPVSTMLTAKDYRFLVEDSRAAAVLVSAEFAPGGGPGHRRPAVPPPRAGGGRTGTRAGLGAAMAAAIPLAPGGRVPGDR